MADSSSSSSGGIGFVGLLTILFIALKLLGKIDWSWWWVLSPLWISAILVTLVLVGVFAVMLVMAALESRDKRRRLPLTRARSSLGARRTTGRVIDVENSSKDKSTIH